MSTETNNKTELVFEIQLKLQLKTYNLAIRLNPRVILSILLPIAVKVISILLAHYGATAP